MFKSMIAGFQSRHGISQVAVLELGALLQKVALSNASVLHTMNYGPASVRLDQQEEDPVIEPPGDDVEAITTGRYDDLGLLGTGGMGEVRQVLDKDLGRTMAMKILRADLMDRPKVVARFIEEAQCSAQLQHPGLVPVHEVGKLPDGRLYFTMAEIRGRTFGEVIAGVHAASPFDRWATSAAGWTFRGLIDAFSRVCEAVAYAHGRGVVHRDLKPDNIMIGDHGAVRVVDWGLAKVMGRPDLAAEAGDLDPVVTDRSLDDSLNTRIGAVAGTPAYMPPEQARGEVDRIDARSDVYALGAVLYEILSGRAPYVGASGRALLDMVLAGPPEPLGEAARPGNMFTFSSDDERAQSSAVSGRPLPPDLVEACGCAMARDRDDRFTDAGALAVEIAAWLDGARRREQALEVVTVAEAQGPAIAALHARAADLETEAEALLVDVKSYEPEAHKAPGWAKEDEAADLRREAERRDLQCEQGLTGALQIDPTLPEAHAALAERYWSAHEAAEQRRDTDAAVREAHLLQSHAEALPEDHEMRQRCAVYLKGDGALTLTTDPPGAEVLLHRHEAHNRRLVPVLQRSLGRTPLRGVSLPMGSYLCVLRSDGRPDVRYPVHIERSTHWHGVPPGGGEPHAIWLPGSDDLGADDCYVPAGWFTAGGDAETPFALSRRRVWVEGFSLSSLPVTNHDYIGFLDDLVAQGREDEALRYAPRERPGTVGEQGSLIYSYQGGRFSLRPDADGDVWLPDWPVVMVDWSGAAGFAAWQAARTGQAWRLAHELEWEKAARGVDGRLFPWGDGFDSSWCHMRDSHRGRNLLARVGGYPVDESVYGVRDLAGNIREWTATVHQEDGDVWDGDRLSPGQGVGEAGDRRIFRGGSWGDRPAFGRVASRRRAVPGSRDDTLGLRLVRTIP